MTAEITKLVENAYRDVNIALANELSMSADELDVDVWEVISLANRHPSVNILNPGPGVGVGFPFPTFGDPVHEQDPRGLRSLCQCGAHPVKIDVGRDNARDLGEKDNGIHFRRFRAPGLLPHSWLAGHDAAWTAWMNKLKELLFR